MFCCTGSRHSSCPRNFGHMAVCCTAACARRRWRPHRVRRQTGPVSRPREWTPASRHHRWHCNCSRGPSCSRSQPALAAVAAAAVEAAALGLAAAAAGPAAGAATRPAAPAVAAAHPVPVVVVVHPAAPAAAASRAPVAVATRGAAVAVTGPGAVVVAGCGQQQTLCADGSNGNECVLARSLPARMHAQENACAAARVCTPTSASAAAAMAAACRPGTLPRAGRTQGCHSCCSQCQGGTPHRCQQRRHNRRQTPAGRCCCWHSETKMPACQSD